MKKILLVMAAMLCVATVSAQHKWAAGLRVGSGLQAQGEYSYADNRYVEARFGMGWLGGVSADFTALHNWNVCNWDWTPSVGKWYLDAGCGLNIGGRPHRQTYYGVVIKGSYAYFGVAGQVKFGIKFNKVPIRLSIDYTPVIGAEVATAKAEIMGVVVKEKGAAFYGGGLGNFGVSATWCF